MAYTPASRDEERRLQETFGELHHRGEWFYNQQKLLDLIQYLSEDYPRPTERMADRETFEGAIWDVVITGMEHPDMPDVESYRRSGQGRLWRHMYPEMMDYPDLVAELFA